MRKLSAKQEKIYRRSIKLGKLHGSVEENIVENLIEVETEKIHKALGKSSLFLYCQEVMNLSDPTALSLIAVARKAMAVPALRKALAEKRLTPSKATRVISHINNGNADEILDYATQHTYREIDYEMARRNPRARTPDKFKPISEDEAQATITVKIKTSQRIQSVLAQKGKPFTLSDAVDSAFEYYLDREDPVRKAKRATAKKVCVHRVKTVNREGTEPARPISRASETVRNSYGEFVRIPLTAEQEHGVNARDGGCCTFIKTDGTRCNSDRWVGIHHIIHVSLGGTNDIENLTTLCSFHHDMVHQLSLGLYGDVNWLETLIGWRGELV